MPKTFKEILPALEVRLEQAKLGALPIGHAMELRRRERRQAMGCPTDEEVCGYVDGALRVDSAVRWAEVGRHVHQCKSCQDDVEGLCEALELDLCNVAATHQPVRQRLFRFVAPIAAVATVLVLAALGVRAYLPTLAGWSPDSHDINGVSDLESPVHAPVLVDRQQTAKPKDLNRYGASTMKVSISSDSSISVSSVLRVAICSETEPPTCEEGMTLMSAVGAECGVTGDVNSCFAKSAAGGCAICLVAK
jgi:hypothetical protein